MGNTASIHALYADRRVPACACACVCTPMSSVANYTQWYSLLHPEPSSIQCDLVSHRRVDASVRSGRLLGNSTMPFFSRAAESARSHEGVNDGGEGQGRIQMYTLPRAHLSSALGNSLAPSSGLQVQPTSTCTSDLFC